MLFFPTQNEHSQDPLAPEVSTARLTLPAARFTPAAGESRVPATKSTARDTGEAGESRAPATESTVRDTAEAGK